MAIRSVLPVVLLLAGCSAGATSTETTPGGTAAPTGGEVVTVVRVLDGDSLVVQGSQGDREVRLLGINAPEGTECYGDLARDKLEQLVGDEVTLVAAGEDTDRFGRLLRYVDAAGMDVNLEMIAGGHAVVVQGEHPRNDEYVAVADVASSSQIGLWSSNVCGSAVAPGSVDIVGYVYNPPGRDEEDLNGEWVAFRNDENEPVAMGGWILRDESTQNRYRFPDGFVLRSGREVRVNSGCGEDTQDVLHWCSDFPVWSNGGDTVILQDLDGTVVLHDRFSGQF
ncbi:MAG: lamin tail domain-containing protein [Acidimicrobiia bacterium]|nr:lamin tail domain-containing protein [Acidimicrobiia bacterium]